MDNEQFKALVRFDEMSKDHLLNVILAMAQTITDEFGRGDRVKMPELDDIQMTAFYALLSEEQMFAIAAEQREKRENDMRP